MNQDYINHYGMTVSGYDLQIRPDFKLTFNPVFSYLAGDIYGNFLTRK